MTSAATRVLTLFGTERADSLRREHLTRLAAGILGCVQVPGFLTPVQCASIMAALDACEMGSYDEAVVWPRIAKIGPTAYDYYASGHLDDRYWAEAQAARRARAGLLDGTDPMDLAVARLAQAWGGPVRYANSGGREMFGGIIREINHGARLHFDEIVREMLDAVDEAPISQVTFNCHLSVPPDGGESVVYRRRWRPADEQHRDGYGYALDIVAGEPSAQVRAEIGDAVLFDPRDYHLVRPGRGGRRTTLSFFAGITGDGTLVLWS